MTRLPHPASSTSPIAPRSMHSPWNRKTPPPGTLSFMSSGTTYDTLAADDGPGRGRAGDAGELLGLRPHRARRGAADAACAVRPYRRDRLGDGAAREPGQRRLCGEQGRTAVLCPHAGDRNRQARRHGELHSARLRRYRDAGAVSRHIAPPSKAASPPAASPGRRRSPRSSHSWPRRPPATSTAPISRWMAA